VAGVATCAIALVGLGPADWWLCDLFANLRLHTVAALAVLAFLALWQRIAGLAATVVASLIAIVFVELTADRDAAPVASLSRSLAILSYNLGPVAERRAEVRTFLRGSGADLLILQEYSPRWHEALGELAVGFPHVLAEPLPGAFGIAVYSRLPLDGSVRRFPGSRIPYVHATVGTGAGPLLILGLHLQWPIEPDAFAERNEQLAYLLETYAASDDALLACGDWNLTPWSGWFRRLREAGLSAGAPGWSLDATWPSGLAKAGIAIDHCLASASVGIVARQPGPALGSDHRPLKVRAGVKATPAASPASAR